MYSKKRQARLWATARPGAPSACTGPETCLEGGRAGGRGFGGAAPGELHVIFVLARHMAQVPRGGAPSPTVARDCVVGVDDIKAAGYRPAIVPGKRIVPFLPGAGGAAEGPRC